ncbi:MAG: AAA domain-containing protein [Mangrovibacterium sp.]
MEDEIIQILSKGEPLKSKQIAALIGGATKNDVNAILYGKLRGRVVQNREYEWSLKQNGANNTNDGEDKNTSRTDTLLGKLSCYFLECISKDLDNGISEFATNRYGLPNYAPLNQLIDEDTAISIEYTKISNLVRKLRENRNGLSVTIGYPVQLVEHKSRTGYPYYMVMPSLIQSLDSDAFLRGEIRLSDENPYVNADAIVYNESISETEVIQEIIQLNADLGLDSIDLRQIGEVGPRLKEFRVSWRWAEEINPYQLSDIDLSSTKTPGIYNVCSIFLTERSKYTIGLEKDLNDLSRLNEEGYRGSILGKILHGNLKSHSVPNSVLLEPLSMNEEQRQAVLNGLVNDMTVVTGPPGTGKSQVVSNLIVNAVHKGQKVLFASKNKKAVDVVLERVNGLTNKPVMLRLGSSAMQNELSQYLTGVISTRVSEDDKIRFQKANKQYEILVKQVTDIEQQQNKYIELRNETDIREQQLESVRERLGADLFRYLFGLGEAERIKVKDGIAQLSERIDRATFSKAPFFGKIGWLFIKNNRLKELSSKLESLNTIWALLKVTGKDASDEKLAVAVAVDMLNSVKSRLDETNEIILYKEKLTLLREQKSLEQMMIEENRLIEQISENSLELWNSWINLLSDRLSPNERQIIGEYITVLDLIIKAGQEGQSTQPGIWAKYYNLLPKIASILSCWAVTSLSVRSKVPFESGFFDMVIIDEASQCDIASAIPLLFRAKRAIIIGDDKQLTHISSITNHQDNQLLEKYELLENHLLWSYSSTSLFRLAASLCGSEDIIQLKDHHRSHADIISYSNKYFYDSSLRVATRYDRLKNLPNEQVLRWIDIKGKVITPSGGGSLNEIEAKRVVLELQRLVDAGYQGTIGVVAPFRAHATRIRDLVSADQSLFEQLSNREFLADTVHKFQGDERDLMIFSTVVAEGVSKGSESFLANTGNLFNVAITRARAALIVVGDMAACLKSRVKHFAQFAEHVKSINEKANEQDSNLHIDYGPKFPTVSIQDRVSDWEKILYDELYRAGIRTLPQYKVEKYSLDLALFENGKKLDIEVDGEAYHRGWDGELMRRDKIRNRRLIELGWYVQRFWVYEVRDDMESCIRRIKYWIEKAKEE